MNYSNKVSCIIFVLYFWMFALLRPILQLSGEYSTVILFSVAVIFILISLLITKADFSRNELISLAIIFGIIFLLLIDLLLRRNSYTGLYIYEFLIYGAIPLYLFSKVIDYKYMLRCYVYVSIVVVLIYLIDPLNDYSYSIDYMTYGFFMMPAYFGLLIGRKLFNFKLLYPLEIISLIFIFLFGNKGAALSAVIFLIVINLVLHNKVNYKTVVIYSLLIKVGLIAFFNLNAILLYFQSLLYDIGVRSYAIDSTINSLIGNEMLKILSGRDALWVNAFELFRGNPFIGSGIGAYQEVYSGIYTHNVILDIVIFYGVAGFIFFGALLVKSLINVYRATGYFKIVGLLILCMWFPKLLTSIHLFKEPGFWLFIYYGFINIKKTSISQRMPYIRIIP